MLFKFSARRGAVVLLLAQCLFLVGINTAAVADDAGSVQLKDVDSITILPIAFPADQTAEDRAENLESLYGKLDDYIYKALLRKLAMKGYVLDKPRGWSMPADWSVETLKPLSPQELAAILPDTASYAAYLFVEHIGSSSQVVKSSANATVSAMILHRDSGVVVWSSDSEGRFAENIIFNGMWLTPDKHAAIEKAFGKLFADLPEKPF